MAKEIKPGTLEAVALEQFKLLRAQLQATAATAELIRFTHVLNPQIEWAHVFDGTEGLAVAGDLRKIYENLMGPGMVDEVFK